jgi:peptide/nickel transport system substrate-binding protein
MGGAQSSDGTTQAGGHLVYDEFKTPIAAWAPETDDAHQLSRVGCLETLLRYQADGSLAPNLATSWKQVKPTVWTVTLRDGVKFQDGTRMDAKAVAGALNHVLQAKTPARAFKPSVVAGVKALDASTVEITTKAPDVLLPLRLASPNTGILAPKAYAGSQIDIKGTCTGPFTVVSEAPGRSLELKRNDNYWGGKPHIATAEVRFIVDGATRVTQIQAGEAQIVSAVPAVSQATLQGDNAIKVESLQAPRTTALMLNNARPPFNNPLVRQAIQHAVNLDSIASSVYEGGAKPAIGPFSADDPWAPKGAKPAAYDPKEAKRLLSQAGVDPSSLSFELVAYNDRPEFGDLAAVIQDQLAKIGIKVKIKAGEYAAFEPDFLAGNFDAALFSRGYLIDVGEPAGYLTSDYGCKGGFNIAHYCNPQTDALIQKVAETTDAEARYQLYAQVAEKLQADAASVFLVHESLTTAISSDVKNFKTHPLNYYVLTRDLSIG